MKSKLVALVGWIIFAACFGYLFLTWIEYVSRDEPVSIVEYSNN